MTNHHEPPQATDWPAIALWTLVPLVVAAGFVYAAMTPQWESDDWVRGLLVLIPLEYFRAFVTSILSDTYREYRTPLQAARFFLVSLLILIVIAAAISLYVLGFRDFIDLIRKPEVYTAVALALAVIGVDGVIGVYFFRGDPLRLAARLQAVADDAKDWLQLAAFQAPIVLALSYGVLLLLKESRGGFAWVPDVGSDALRSACLLYAAFYFFGKAILLAHANTAQFNRTGRRLFASRWIQLLIWQKSQEREISERNERSAESKRRAVLSGEAEPGVAPEG